MPYSESLANRVREALMDLPNVYEKKMFGGLTFMVNDKMCIGIRNEEIMCRIDPEIFETVLERGDSRPMIHGGKVKKGFVFVHEEVFIKKADFDYWINLALEYNKFAKASK